jgi:DNA primase
MSDQIEEIKSKLDIVTVVQGYVPTLRPSGRNYFGLCPFHQEKSPSFSVNPELGIYKCFGCGEGGDVISFYQKMEGLDFREALEFAAEKAGVKLERFDNPGAQKYKDEQDRAIKAHNLAAQFYHYLLSTHKNGAVGREYAQEKRKLHTAQINEFLLGFAPKGYHNLEQFLIKKGFKRDELVKMGLLAEKSGKIYDKFRGRLMHPIFDLRGKVLAFSGRIIDKDSQAPKYLNSPETIIYHKKKTLYGLYQAKEEVRKLNYVIMVEGNIDVVSSHKLNVKNIVCPLGTALTAEQLQLLKRYCDTIYFAFDTDNAGKKALLRSLELCETAGFNAKAIDLRPYKDADELINADPASWPQRVSTATEIPEFIIELFKADYDLASSQEKEKFIVLVLPYIKRIKSKVRINHYLDKLSRLTQTKYDIIAEMLDKYVEHEPQAATIKTDQPQVEVEEIVKPAEISTKKINSRLGNLLAYLYDYSQNYATAEQLAELQQIATNYLPKSEVELIESALRIEGKNHEANLKLIAEIIAEKTIKFTDNESLSDLKKLLLQYIHHRLKDYIKASRKQDVDLTKLKVYADKISLVEAQLLNS